MSRIINFREDIEQKHGMSISDVFKKLSKQDMSYHDVAVELDHSENTIRTWSNKTGIKLKPSTREKRNKPTVSKAIKDVLSQKWI